MFSSDVAGAPANVNQIRAQDVSTPPAGYAMISLEQLRNLQELMKLQKSAPQPNRIQQLTIPVGDSLGQRAIHWLALENMSENGLQDLWLQFQRGQYETISGLILFNIPHSGMVQLCRNLNNPGSKLRDKITVLGLVNSQFEGVKELALEAQSKRCLSATQLQVFSIHYEDDHHASNLPETTNRLIVALKNVYRPPEAFVALLADEVATPLLAMTPNQTTEIRAPKQARDTTTDELPPAKKAKTEPEVVPEKPGT